MRILIAPEEFKGTLTAAHAAKVMAHAIARRMPAAQLDLAPISDGGPGLVDALLGATGGSSRVTAVQDPLGRTVDATWGILDFGRSAVIESAAACGLVLLRPEERDPARASSFGVGQLIAAALDAGCSKILVGVGGTATNDGGTGAALALGARFLDSAGRELPPGGAALASLARIDISARDRRLESAELLVATDVSNPLCGPRGASHIYGPQKGASPAIVQLLDAALFRLAAVARYQLGISGEDQPGAGAGGGLGYGLAFLCGGRICPGFETFARFLDLDRRISQADIVLTGEGRLDLQTTAFGKGPGAIAQRARAAAKRVIIFAGRVDSSYRPGDAAFDEVVALTPGTENTPDPATAERTLDQAVDAWALRSSAGAASAERG
jgi:glycerate kinase